MVGLVSGIVDDVCDDDDDDDGDNDDNSTDFYLHTNSSMYCVYNLYRN